MKSLLGRACRIPVQLPLDIIFGPNDASKVSRVRHPPHRKLAGRRLDASAAPRGLKKHCPGRTPDTGDPPPREGRGDRISSRLTKREKRESLALPGPTPDCT